MDRAIAPPRFALLLQPEFPINALVLASEALRIANQNSGRHLFDWELVSLDGEAVRASNGLWLSVDASLGGCRGIDYCMLFEGNLPTQHNSPTLLHRLRELSRAGTTLIGVDTGAFALAQAGLVSESVVLHWEAASTFHERFDRLATSDQLFKLDQKIHSCAGGVATLDFMLELIRKHYGPTLANEVANALVHVPRESWQPQRHTAADSTHRSFADRLIEVMEQHLDFPLKAAELAKRLSVSPSTLDRQCRRQFGHTPMRLYLGVRLQAARNFLFYEDCSIREVARAYGFSSPAVFSRTFKSYFGHTPLAFRRSVRERQAGSRLPDVTRLRASRHRLELSQQAVVEP